MDVIDFSGSLESLKGTACDPDETILVDVYSLGRQQFRTQLFKRINLIRKRVSYTGVDGKKHVGEIIGFNKDDGNPVIGYREGLSPPIEGTNEIMLVE